MTQGGARMLLTYFWLLLVEFWWQSPGRLVETVLLACEWPQRRLCLTPLVMDPVDDGVGFAFSVCCHAGDEGLVR